MLEAVVDTNVLAAASRLSIGASYRLLQTIEDRTWRPVISPALAFEYEAVLKRGTAETGMTLEDVDDFIEYLCSRSRLVQIYFRWRPALPHPNDDRIQGLALRTVATIVTFNTRDFVGADRFGVGVVSPRELLKRIGIGR